MLRVRILNSAARAPVRKTPAAAAYDLVTPAKATVPANGRVLVPLGIAIELPEGSYGQIAPVRPGDGV